MYEVGPVFRAEKHSTARHLNEYTGLDLEMGYIDSFYDVIEVETGFLKYAMDQMCIRDRCLTGSKRCARIKLRRL